MIHRPIQVIFFDLGDTLVEADPSFPGAGGWSDPIVWRLTEGTGLNP